MPQTQALDQLAISHDFVLLKVAQQALAHADHLQQTARNADLVLTREDPEVVFRVPDQIAIVRREAGILVFNPLDPPATNQPFLDPALRRVLRRHPRRWPGCRSGGRAGG